jgi:hypothetical protein
MLKSLTATVVGSQRHRMDVPRLLFRCLMSRRCRYGLGNRKRLWRSSTKALWRSSTNFHFSGNRRRLAPIRNACVKSKSHRALFFTVGKEGLRPGVDSHRNAFRPAECCFGSQQLNLITAKEFQSVRRTAPRSRYNSRSWELFSRLHRAFP